MKLFKLFFIFITQAQLTLSLSHSWAVHLVKRDGSSFNEKEAIEVSKKSGVNYGISPIVVMYYVLVAKIGGLEGYFLFQVEHSKHALQKRSQIEEKFNSMPHLKWFEYQEPLNRKSRKLRRRSIRLPNGDVEDEEDIDIGIFLDPLFSKQWHLINDGENALQKGNDIHVSRVWENGITGAGVTVSVLDDGVDTGHPDMASQWSRLSSFDFESRTNDARPHKITEVHGTRCAGQIVAQPNNGICGVGVAYGAKFSSERVMFEGASDATEAEAFNYAWDTNDIYSSSWGPSDDGKTVDGPRYLAQRSLIAGVSKGRKGKGSIFVFASGNGGNFADNCNFDGFANSIYTVAIGAINHLDMLPPYGEQCSAHLAVTYSGGKGRSISTTDGNGTCTSSHSGTSAAAPIAAGIIALVLQVRPELGWRDIQQLIVDTAVQNDIGDPDWTINGAGKHINHKYGFGKLNANLIVEKAKTHQLLPHPGLVFSKSKNTNAIIPLSGTENGLIEEIEIETTDLLGVGLSSLEHVQVTVKLRHEERKNLQISLTSPDGTVSILATRRVEDTSPDGFLPWTFMTVRNWGERGIGKWKLHVHDFRTKGSRLQEADLNSHGQLESWELILHGTCGSEYIKVITDSNGLQSSTCMGYVEVELDNSRKINTIMVIIIVVCSLMILIFLSILKCICRKRTAIKTGFNDISNIEMESPLKYDLESPNPIVEAKHTFVKIKGKSPESVNAPVLKSQKIFPKLFKKTIGSGDIVKSASNESLLRTNLRDNGRIRESTIKKSTSLSCITVDLDPTVPILIKPDIIRNQPKQSQETLQIKKRDE